MLMMLMRQRLQLRLEKIRAIAMMMMIMMMMMMMMIGEVNMTQRKLVLSSLPHLPSLRHARPTNGTEPTPAHGPRRGTPVPHPHTL